MKRFRRMISGLMALCMVLSMVPVQAWAEEPVTETAAVEATEAVTQPTEGTSAPTETVEETTGTTETETVEETTAPAETEAAEETTAATEETVPEGTVVTAAQKAADSVVDSGTCGDNLTWVLDDAGTLTISGTGAMEDYEYDYVPWFDQREDIQKVVVQTGVTEIGYAAFDGCTNLTHVSLPDGLTSLGQHTFIDCTSLIEVNIPYGVINLAPFVFSGCCSLTSIVIPSSVTTIYGKAFLDCSGLTSIYFEGDAPAFKTDNIFSGVYATAYYPEANDSWTEAVMQDYGGTITWESYIPAESGDSIIVGTCGDDLTWILGSEGTLTISGTGDMTRYSWDEAPWLPQCEQISSVVIQDGVTSIGDYAFQQCSNLTSIEIPESVTAIRYGAFYGCSSLTDFEFPGGITKVDGSLFEGCFSLTEIVIPAKVTMVCSFAFQGCTGMQKVTFEGSAPEIGEAAFLSVTATVYYPSGDSTWTADVMQDYGGSLTWVANGSGGEVPAPETPACRLSELTALDYLAFSDVAYEDFFAGETVQDCMKRLGKWDSVWGADEITYSELCAHIADWTACKTKDLDKENGFYGVAFRNDDNEVVIAYRGSVPPDQIDSDNTLDAVWDWLVSDLRMQILNVVEDETQHLSAADFYESVMAFEDWQGVVLTGHSLGGGLAHIVSAQYGCKAVTMNSISVLDAAYEALPYELSGKFEGVNKWNIRDHTNLFDAVAGMWEYHTEAEELKPYTAHLSNNTVLLTDGKLNLLQTMGEILACHGMSTFVSRDENGNVVINQEVLAYTRTTPFSNSLDLDRHVNLGTSGGDTFSNGLAESNEEVTYGGNGNDIINSATDADILIGGKGGDTLDGGWGDDTYIYHKGDNVDSIKDAAGDDTIRLFGFSASDEISVYDESEDSKYVYVLCNGEIILMIHKDGRSYGALGTLDSFKIVREDTGETEDITDIFHKKNYGEVVLYQCPVNVEILDAEGNVVFTLTDGEVGNWYNEYGNFYVFEEKDGGYGKLAELVEGYTARAVGVDTGTMDIEYREVVNGELAEPKKFAEVPITSEFTGTLEETEDGEVVLSADTDGDDIVDTKIGYDGKAIPVESVTLEQEYLALKVGGKAQLLAEVRPAELTEFLTWEVEDKSTIISVSETGEVTANEVGTAYVIASVDQGGVTLTARCRVDVAEMDAQEPEKIDIRGVQLSTDKLTSELYSTDYAELDVLLILPQNDPAAQGVLAASSAAAMTQAEVKDNGVAIEKAEFTDEATAKLFSISILDDRRVQIVPTAYAVEHPKEVAGKYTSAITVTVQGEEYTSEALTLTVKKTTPKLKAAVPAFNSFYTGQSRTISATGGTVTVIYEDASKNTAKTTAIPDWLTLENGVLTLTEDAPLKSTSGKAYVLVETEEWRIPVALTLSVKNTYKVPGLKLSATSVTMATQAENSTGVELKLLCKNKKDTLEALAVTGITDPEGYKIENFNVDDGSFLLKAEDGFQTGKITLNVIFGDTGNTLPLTLTVKTAATKLKLSAASVTLNTAGDSAKIAVTATPADYALTELTIDGNEAGCLTTEFSEGILTVSTNDATEPGKTYVLNISAGGSKAVKLTVKTTENAPTVTLKAKGNLDLSFPKQTVTVTSVFKNYSGGYSITNVTAVDAKKNPITGFTAVQENGTIAVTCTPETAPGSYTLTLELKLDNGMPCTGTVKVTVKRTAVKLKLSATKLTLNKLTGDTGTVAVSCTTKGYVFDLSEAVLTYDETKLNVERIGGNLTVSLKDAAEYGKTYPVSISAAYQGAPAVKLNVAVLKQNAVVKSTIKATGTLDVIRSETAIIVKPTYTNVLNVDVDQDAVLKIYTSEDKYGTVFATVSAENGIFTIDDSVITDHSLKYRAQLETQIAGTTVVSNVISLSVKMGTAKLTLEAAEDSLFAKDSRDRLNFCISAADGTLNEIAEVTVKDAKYQEQFKVLSYGSGRFALCFRDGKVDSSLIGKTVTLTLNVRLEGNETTKPNAAVKLKLRIVP